MQALVYILMMRAPVVKVRHRTDVSITKTSRLTGFSKMGDTQRGGFAAVPLRRACSAARASAGGKFATTVAMLSGTCG